MSSHNLCFEQKSEKYQIFLSENFPFLVIKFSIYLNMCVFVILHVTSRYEQQCKKLFSLKCTPNVDSDQSVHLCSLISLCCLHEATLHPWLSKMLPVKILTKLHELAG